MRAASASRHAGIVVIPDNAPRGPAPGKFPGWRQRLTQRLHRSSRWHRRAPSRNRPARRRATKSGIAPRTNLCCCAPTASRYCARRSCPSRRRSRGRVERGPTVSPVLPSWPERYQSSGGVHAPNANLQHSTTACPRCMTVRCLVRLRRRTAQIISVTTITAHRLETSRSTAAVVVKHGRGDRLGRTHSSDGDGVSPSRTARARDGAGPHGPERDRAKHGRHGRRDDLDRGCLTRNPQRVEEQREHAGPERDDRQRISPPQPRHVHRAADIVHRAQVLDPRASATSDTRSMSRSPCDSTTPMGDTRVAGTVRTTAISIQGAVAERWKRIADSASSSSAIPSRTVAAVPRRSRGLSQLRPS